LSSNLTPPHTPLQTPRTLLIIMSQMRVARFYPPGGPEKLRLENDPIPHDLKENEVLVKVHAVGLIWPELTWPIYQNEKGEYMSHIPGHDYSGVVVKLGSAATQTPGLKPGTEVAVFTSRRNHEGGLAEYAIADVDQLIPKPKNLDLIHTASMPLSALTAWQALYDFGKLKKGQRVLITGAAGGTGVFAVQFARLTGAYVIGTGSSTRSREILSELKIDQFVDYQKHDLKEAVGEVDLVVDCVGGRSFESARGVVKEGGYIVSINEVQAEKMAQQKGIRSNFFIVSMSAEQLSIITKLVEEGKVKTFVDKVVPFENIREAYEDAAQGHVHGKVIVKVEG
jgi:NADPH:quinone reductase-like Zn-dependent oxidoreductase